MRRMTLVLAGLAALGLLALAGCTASTKLTSVWTEPGLQPNSLKKLMVIAVAQNPTIRRVFEDTFIAALKDQGVEAVASYSLVGDGPLDSARVVGAIRENGCDGVFISRVVDKQTVETYYPPTTTYAAPSPYYGNWYGYYSTGYSYTTSPGYTVQNQVVNIETNLYRVADVKLVWSALSESWLEQTGNPGGEIKPFIQQLVYSLGTSKVVGKSGKK